MSAGTNGRAKGRTRKPKPIGWRNAGRRADEVQAFIDQLRPAPRDGIRPCSVCGHQMLPTKLGHHASCTPDVESSGA